MSSAHDYNIAEHPVASQAWPLLSRKDDWKQNHCARPLDRGASLKQSALIIFPFHIFSLPVISGPVCPRLWVVNAHFFRLQP